MGKLVGIDASRYTTQQRTGTENYSYHLLNAMLAADHAGLDFRFYLNSSDQTVLPVNAGAEPRPIPFPRLWTHVRLSAEMLTRRPDLLFVPSHVVPLIHPRSVVTIHDLGYLHEPDSHPRRQRLMLDATTRWNARVSRKIIAISHATQRELVERYDVDPGKITVIEHGVTSDFGVPAPNQIASLREQLQLPEHFVLSVGTIQPRKNLGQLARAVKQLRDQELPIVLVTAGKRGWMADQVEAEIGDSLSGDGWRHLGYVSDDQLPELYRAATAVALVSRYEGFGLPVLEAMACGAPVIISDRGSLPEVAGGCALIANPDDPAAIATEIRRLIDDPSLRESLIERGQARASIFSWERAARETIEVLRDALRSP